MARLVSALFAMVIGGFCMGEGFSLGMEGLPLILLGFCVIILGIKIYLGKGDIP